MTHILLLSMWAIAISAWYSAAYFHRCASTGIRPDTTVVIKCISATGISLFIGTVVYSFIQATIVRGLVF